MSTAHFRGIIGAVSPVERLTPDRRRELTRSALVEAAVEVFARRGFDGASLEEIAEVAGFTRGAIYSNFGNKEDLLLAVVDRYSRTLFEAFSHRLEQADTLEEKTVAGAALWRDLIHRDPTLSVLNLEFRLRALRNDAFRERLLELQRQHVERIAELIRTGAESVGIKLKVAPQDLAEILNAATVGLSDLARLDPDQARRYDELVELFFRLIGDSIYETDPDQT
jgi:AcrR family transcriptional regulator